jgi:hypothetical protein
VAKTKAQAKAAEEQAGDEQSTESGTAGDPGSGDSDPGDGVKEKAAALAADASSTAAAPLEAPEKYQQRTPHLGDPGTSTNPVAANTGLSSVPGSDHHRLLNEAGDPVPLDEVFEFPEYGSPSTLAVVRTRVFEEFTYPNTTTRTRHLMFPAGERVPVAEARRIIETYKHAEESELPQG